MYCIYGKVTFNIQHLFEQNIYFAQIY